jgi:squalene synthase HpnC
MRGAAPGTRPYNALVPAPHHAVDHYENFPVASWLMPARLRPAVVAIYRFARHADDLADEGSVSAQARHAALAGLQSQLLLARQDGPVDEPLVAALVAPMRAHALPWSCLEDLLSAFIQDIDVHRYDTREAVMDYCRRSANPVGRLVLALAGVSDASALSESDAICSALQRINFLQDLGIDWPRGRLYLPQTLLESHGLDESAIARACDRGRCDEALRTCIATEALDCRRLLASGRQLPRRVGGRMGLELRAILAGGELILDQLARQGHDPLWRRPRIRRVDAWALAWAMWRGVRVPRPPHSSDDLRAPA